ncbi:hypothetical protein [Microvirga sp. VF16]|uniref:hypothetical protein n=1 Tax=Microvirga sp. VF16 TaxID=2807101 RepID=UPI00193CB4BD|nr:hypothetical protein [Microvirga sp. VF16]QRM35456.1 hypothetical protein JO965_44780 [Microvirga sp. VF16]
MVESKANGKELMLVAPDYSFSLHSHRFAAWCAATAASASKKCRFSVLAGVKLIEQSGLSQMAAGWNMLPDPEEFDAYHRGMRERLVALAPFIVGSGPCREFTHGVAAKLINCYLKPLYVVGPSDPQAMPEAQQEKLNAVHPPIDRLLLTSLIAADTGPRRVIWRKAKETGWSTFSSADYEAVIEAVRDFTSGELWKIERHWSGYQSSMDATN